MDDRRSFLGMLTAFVLGLFGHGKVPAKRARKTMLVPIDEPGTQNLVTLRRGCFPHALLADDIAREAKRRIKGGKWVWIGGRYFLPKNIKSIRVDYGRKSSRAICTVEGLQSRYIEEYYAN